MAAPEVVRHLPDLLPTLTDLGHPYGLILVQQGSSHQSAESSIQNNSLLPLSEQSVVSGEISKDPLANNDVRDAVSSFFWANISSSSAPAISLAINAIPIFFSSASILTASGASIGEQIRKIDSIPNSLRDEESAYLTGDILAAASSIITPLSLSHLIAPLYVDGKHNKAQTKNIPIALITPFLAKAIQKESLSRSHELLVDKRGLTFGTASLRLSTYRGTEPFVVKFPDGTPVIEIQPGDPLAHMHISHQAFTIRDLSPLEKARVITADTIALLSAIDHTDPQTLNPEQQQTLAQARDATILGISHLVRLFHRTTSLPTWKLDILPEMLQRFHTLDSQAVSNQFGGQRRVKPEDVEMLVITPSQRRQLLANLQG